MHNNGSSRLILPDRGPILGSLNPTPPNQGVQLEVLPNGTLIAHISVGDDKLDLTLNPQTATQLGVNLISAAALCGSGLIPPAPATPSNEPRIAI